MAKLQNPEKALTDRLDALCREIEEDVKKSIEEPPPEKRFESVNMVRERAALEVRDELKALQDIFSKGMEVIISALEELKKEEELNEILAWFNNNSDKVCDFIKLSDPDIETKTFEDELGFPRKFIISMHDAATYLLNEKKYDDAIAAIAVCLQFNPTLSPLWYTYGSILQNRGDHESALYVFQTGAVLDEKNPYFPAHMARSWVELTNWDNALASIQQAKNLCANFPEYVDILKYCDELEAWIKKTRNSKIQEKKGEDTKNKSNDEIKGQ